MILVVDSECEFEEAFPYSREYIKSSDYPESYPAIMVVETAGGGICGEYQEVRFFYPPDEDYESFFAGFKAGYEFNE